MTLKTALQPALFATFVALFAPPPARADSPQAKLFTSSFAFEAKGHPLRALEDMETLLKAAPKHYVATLRAGWLAYQAKKYAPAIHFYRRAITLAPQAIEPQLGLMLPLMAARRWSKCAAVARAILKRAPGSYLARSRLAYTLFSQGHYAQALPLYQGLIADYPADLDMHLGLAWTHLKQGHLTQARAAFQGVLAIRPNNQSANAGLSALPR